MTFYEIYDVKRNQYSIMDEKTLRHMYEVKGNHIDYPSFGSWVSELISLGIAREV